MKNSSWIAIEMLRKTFPCRVYVSFNPHDDILLMFASWAAPLPLVDFSTSPLSASYVILNPGMSILLTISTVVSTCSIQIGGHSGTKHDCSSREQSVQTDAILWWSKLSILLFSYFIIRLPFSKPSPTMTVFLLN